MSFRISKSDRIHSIILFILLVVFIAGCGITLPPITNKPTDEYHTGKFIWFDLITHDVASAKKFYADIFAWEYDGNESGYTKIMHRGNYIGGMIYAERLKQEVNESQWMSYLSVPDVDRAAAFTQENGGKVIREPWDLDDRGRAAVIADPQGAIIVLLRAQTGDPEDVKPRFGEWLWNELITSNADSAASFYSAMMGFNVEQEQINEQRTYYFMKYGEKYRAGMITSPWENVKPNWLPYIKVQDPKQVVKRVPQLGGEVILAPDDNIRKGSVAIIADPTGGVLAVQKWPIE